LVADEHRTSPRNAPALQHYEHLEQKSDGTHRLIETEAACEITPHPG
jgi:hypothetical protein